MTTVAGVGGGSGATFEGDCRLSGVRTTSATTVAAAIAPTEIAGRSIHARKRRRRSGGTTVVSRAAARRAGSESTGSGVVTSMITGACGVGVSCGRGGACGAPLNFAALCPSVSGVSPTAGATRAGASLPRRDATSSSCASSSKGSARRGGSPSCVGASCPSGSVSFGALPGSVSFGGGPGSVSALTDPRDGRPSIVWVLSVERKAGHVSATRAVSCVNSSGADGATAPQKTGSQTASFVASTSPESAPPKPRFMS